MNLSKFLKQKAVYWRSPVADGYGGYTFNPPIEINVRWSERQDKYLTYKGEEAISRSIVHSDQDFMVGGYLFLGTLNDLTSTDPQLQVDAFLIQATSKVPNIQNTQYMRKAWL
jgi:hypothetical protein